MFLTLLGLIVGFVLLVKGADWLVDGATSIALNLGVSKIVVGLSVVAFGTSLPELVASLVSVIKGHSSVSISNVVGSNIANIAIALALSSLFVSINIKKNTIKAEMPFMIISTIVFTVLFIKDNSLTWNYGVVFISLLVIYLYYLITSAKNVVEEEFKDEVKYKTHIALLLIVVGIVGIWLGGDLTIGNVIKLAKSLGLSETFVGLTIVAIGTSLPEIVVSIISTLKNEADILVGNIVGSNIFNILFILGVSSLVGNLYVDVQNFTIDLIIMNLFVFILFFTSLLRKKIGKVEGIFFLTIYVFYIYQISIRK
ncbi:sodium:calcium antiporter [Thermosipho melanesiensis]|uniref:Na+/Ca+ antiporter, CaCA family n=2 Tax=Thermosipho melanesiensis TaxID=46541 RepID=A6LNC0_THEM4|nr:calcium/sodium antiporter [Thermosipho melanesiensis]ABR31421.1 Na+/Ca+ antiporter, CaCA family [Thermosipho melanesiensis BI429]APT74480.1 sodium:calcium antiporter [Thermosipho melanesiensis]OOC36440.1 sodium:calcium antiporter [Thermosipho melanesiensis]OOC37258.1 sodium:calcium antiporter [Thermosipho melanesiensis]OOC38010.1 sodium:calcium antiporter [Thermosipho melanesiensis]